MKKLDFDKVLKIIVVLLLIWIAKSLDGLSRNGRYLNIEKGGHIIDTRTGTSYILPFVNENVNTENAENKVPEPLLKGFE